MPRQAGNQSTSRDITISASILLSQILSLSLSLSLSLEVGLDSRLVLARVRKNGERSSYVVLQSSFSILNASAIDRFWERFTVSSLGAVPFLPDKSLSPAFTTI